MQPERREKCPLYQKAVDRLVNQVEGNGKPGILSDITDIKTVIAGIRPQLIYLTTVSSIMLVAFITAVIKLFIGK